MRRAQRGRQFDELDSGPGKQVSQAFSKLRLRACGRGPSLADCQTAAILATQARPPFELPDCRHRSERRPHSRVLTERRDVTVGRFTSFPIVVARRSAAKPIDESPLSRCNFVDQDQITQLTGGVRGLDGR